MHRNMHQKIFENSPFMTFTTIQKFKRRSETEGSKEIQESILG
jgi:hypothetical protein